MRNIKEMRNIKFEIEFSKKIFGYTKFYYDGWNYSATILFVKIYMYENYD